MGVSNFDVSGLDASNVALRSSRSATATREADAAQRSRPSRCSPSCSEWTAPGRHALVNQAEMPDRRSAGSTTRTCGARRGARDLESNRSRAPSSSGTACSIRGDLEFAEGHAPDAVAHDLRAGDRAAGRRRLGLSRPRRASRSPARCGSRRRERRARRRALAGRLERRWRAGNRCGRRAAEIEAWQRTHARSLIALADRC